LFCVEPDIGKSADQICRAHVFGDLQPYVCCYSPCEEDLVLFSSRQLWVEHQFSKHLVSRSYKCSQCSQILLNGDDWESHLLHEHRVESSGSHRQVTIAAAEIERDVIIKDMKCPLCYGSLGDSRKSFASHLGRHLEAIALTSIPGNPDEDSASESDVEGTSPHAPPEVLEEEINTHSIYGQVHAPEISTDTSYRFVNISGAGKLNKAQRRKKRTSVMKNYVDSRSKERPLPQFSAVTLQKKSSASEDVILPFPSESLVERVDAPFGWHSALLTDNKETVPSLAPRPAPLMSDSGLPPQIIRRARANQPLEDEDRHKKTGKFSEKFQCTLCPKIFTRAYNLRSHLRTHTDERPFTCTVCGKAFGRQHDRKRHEGLHSGEKRYVCGASLINGLPWGCGRHFARADALGRHFRSEAGAECLKPLLEEEVNQKNAGEVGSGSLESVSRPWPVKLLQQYPELEFVHEVTEYLKYSDTRRDGDNSNMQASSVG